MFIHSRQHPMLDMLGENGVPVFIINLCNVHKVGDKKKVNQPYKEEQEEVYSQIMGKCGAVVEITFVHVPVFFKIWPKHGSSTGRGRTLSQTKSTVGLLYGY